MSNLIKNEIKTSTALIIERMINQNKNIEPAYIYDLKSNLYELLDECKLSELTLVAYSHESLEDISKSLFDAVFLKAVRLSLELTQAEMAHILGWTVRQVSHIENNDRLLKKQTFLALKYLVLINGKKPAIKEAGFDVDNIFKM